MNRQNREARRHLPAQAEAVGDAITALAGTDEREPKWWCTYRGDVRGTFDGNQPVLTLEGDYRFPLDAEYDEVTDTTRVGWTDEDPMVALFGGHLS